MRRPLFCELSPLCYRISRCKGIILHRLTDILRRTRFATIRSTEPQPSVVHRHKSLIHRKLGNTNPTLQQNKAVNLALAVARLDGVLIRPGETFSLWHLVGEPTAKRGYLDGLTIVGGKPQPGTGGGLCQLSNLIHWMVLHSPLDITEHHHHDGVDLFPDYKRRVPFGCGTSVGYSYIDYRFENNTDATFRLSVWTDDTYLCGRLEASEMPPYAYHVRAVGERFERDGDAVYRVNTIRRQTVDRRTGNTVSDEVIRENRARVMYEVNFNS